MRQIIMAKDLTSLGQMLDGGLDPNFRQHIGAETPLHIVAFRGGNSNDSISPEMANLLLDRGQTSTQRLLDLEH
jgi:hypothetical protein